MKQSTKVKDQFAMKKRITLSLLLAMALLPLAQAEVRLPHLFSDGMILQQGKPIRVWGWADEGESIQIAFLNQAAAVVAKDGQFEASLDPVAAGGPYTLKINDRVIQDVWVGEVWVCGGQSNMEWPLRASFEAEKHVAAADNPNIRLFYVPHVRSDTPLDDVDAQWTPCNPETAAGFSAVGYFFGKKLAEELNVPIGLISSNWGGTPAEAWTREEVLAENNILRELFTQKAVDGARHRMNILRWEAAVEEAKAKGENPPGRPWGYWENSVLYNGMIAPLLPYAIGGAIWYQGESNAGQPEQYRELFPVMIKNWREDWRVGDFPFLLVQLAPFMAIEQQPTDPAWAYLREAQLLATKVLPNVGMAVITDVGEEQDIHPRKKEPVGQRLALLALDMKYGKDIVSSGPEFRCMEITGNKVVLHFDHVGSGLVAKDGDLKGFAIAGANRAFQWAEAKIVGDTIEVWHKDISEPVSVRYGWANFPLGNLWNEEGLPATPFRTDQWPRP
jgi:sialate O-acetylesterase